MNDVLTVSDAYEQFLSNRRRRFLSETTLVWYEKMLTRFVAMKGHVRLENLAKEDVWQFLAEINRQERNRLIKRETSRALIRSTKTFLLWAISNYDLDTRIVAEMEQPRPLIAPIRAVEMSIIKRVVDAQPEHQALGIRNRAILYFALGTGCRREGLVGLQMSSLDVGRRVALVTEKGDKTRWVAFGATTQARMAAWLAVRPKAAGEYVFCSLRKRDNYAPLRPDGLTLIFRQMCAKAKLPAEKWFSPHDLRHTFSSQFANAGVSEPILAAQLGHNDPRTTKRYLSISPDTLASAVLRLDPVKSLEALYGEE